MTSGCAPSEVRSECQARGMSAAETAQTLELVEALVLGGCDGRDFSTSDEPTMPASSPGGTPPENLPLQDPCDASEIASKALELIEPALEPWKRSYFARGQSAEDLLEDLGLTPFDLCSPQSIEAECQRLAERPVEATPEFFSPLLIRAGAEEALRRFAGR